MDDVNRNLAPWARTGRAVEANSARVAQQVAGIAPRPQEPGVVDAADVMTGGAAATGGTYSTGGSESSAAPKAKAKARSQSRGKSASLPSNANRTEL